MLTDRDRVVLLVSVIESKTHKITRHLGQKAKAGVLATARGLS